LIFGWGGEFDLGDWVWHFRTCTLTFSILEQRGSRKSYGLDGGRSNKNGFMMVMGYDRWCSEHLSLYDDDAMAYLHTIDSMNLMVH